MAFIRTVKTASAATAVQIVWSWRRGSRSISIEHIGSAHYEVELAALKTAAAGRLAALKTAAAGRLAAGQTELDLGLSEGAIVGRGVRSPCEAGASSTGIGFAFIAGRRGCLAPEVT